ncbi:MAG: integral membrane sensor signal transduction histidine kinase [Dermatophilaceae bacterium]|nr:integral membrane sensor signal transduction histidine kinase [Dermatophilaceae bacterium]NUR17339.1 integral membrane sensor signal transduction histidine kinase [Dermatophilaceae bacterium]
MDPPPPLAPQAVGERTHQNLPLWWTLADGVAPSRVPPLPSRRRMLVQLSLAALAVFALVVVGTSFAASRLAERQVLNDVAHRTNLLALAVIQPALDDRLLEGDSAAFRAFDNVVRVRVVPNGIKRVKLWTIDGTIVYSDEASLVGKHYVLDKEQLNTLAHPRTQAEATDLNRSENEFERNDGKLLEVYQPVWTPNGTELLFEVYGDYEPVQERAFDLWRGLAGVLATSLMLLLVLMIPVMWRLLDRLDAAQHQREALLLRAIEASARERRRIAADLHDGPVQDLVASSLAVSGAAEVERAAGRTGLAATITEAAATVRASVASLRSLLVDIYPERLADAGLSTTLADLARPLSGRGIEVDVDVDEAVAARLSEVAQQLAHRVARECLRNVVRHADACHVTIRLGPNDDDPAHPVLLSVEDDGIGFDPDILPRLEGHFGIRVLADLATEVGAVLRVSSFRGRGTTWQLALPVEEAR